MNKKSVRFVSRKKIISAKNEKIKNIIKLRKARERKKQGMIVIEGRKEIELALSSGIKIVEFYYCPEAAKDADLKIEESIVTEVSEEVFKKISYRDTPDGYLAIAQPRYLNLEEIKLSKNPLVFVLENVEKPGNLGALLRTADAVGVDLVILNTAQIDIYNPNAIRASRGTVFSVQVINLSVQETINYLKENKIQSFAATDKAKKEYTLANFKKPSAIILGAEDKGLSSEWLGLADEKIKIPMQGKIDSLNVSVSGAVIAYEAKRQRG